MGAVTLFTDYSLIEQMHSVEYDQVHRGKPYE